MCTARNVTPNSFACLSVPAISFGDALASVDRLRPGRRLAAAVAVDDDVGRQHLLERSEVSTFGRGEEALDELVTLLPRGFEPRPALVDVPPRTDVELPAVVLGSVDDPGDLVVAVVEDLAEEEDGALDRREALQQDEERHRERVRRLGVRCGVGRRVVGEQRLG